MTPGRALYEEVFQRQLAAGCSEQEASATATAFVVYMEAGAPLRTRVPSFFLPCERGSNSQTGVITRPRLSLAL